ncbi:HepT-like ribonuclease domain-containing protein [Aequorivita vladivostokensis]|uniref:Antitoxin n=1 Tax=Aequorivita vladivostokensis TaxID=171194 RepID=A0ABR5DH20_9FLAO|nr:HepT-like ribonuclease domain-containing protein [Aequorivita vladivostokensis]MAB56017.1 DUF86 domain-containing protein [Aequorivita sp.]KJJ38093.1 hypothetical protein MB09_10690 [Aequorivita vladivostokensis]MBF30312.1 DUF86 domain-containing protein [Aequorivita sp.]HAV54757.1 DUF86 domain-containing protein [Aequorivita sp.]HBL79604.1 DUF86 domain-containing protein [Aequorivita sp.]|tara:strand:+ start:225494 stop:225829 length:336 start_codon:yes stop_codon:yes gene_type:complete
MKLEVEKFLMDISLSINLIEEFISDIDTFGDYEEDIKTQSAVERHLAIIGEALNKLKKIDNDLIIENEAEIIAMRNRLVHAYDSIDSSIVWVIIKKHLPNLKNEVDVILKK